MLVLDATPLLYFAKAGRADALATLDAELLVPTSVHHEVVTLGGERGEPDATAIARLVEAGTLRLVEAPVTSLSKRLEANEGLHAAERDVLVVAQAENARAILDERHGRRIAQAERIAHGGTLYILLRLVRDDSLTPKEARETLERMISAGWYCSTDLYARILRKLEAMGEDDR